MRLELFKVGDIVYGSEPSDWAYMKAYEVCEIQQPLGACPQGVLIVRPSPPTMQSISEYSLHANPYSVLTEQERDLVLATKGITT